jgi:hypothetical protein
MTPEPNVAARIWWTPAWTVVVVIFEFRPLKSSLVA